MIGPSFMDEIDCGSFFDHIDDLLEFPPDDSSNGLAGGKDCNAFPSLWDNPSEGFPGCDSVFSGNSCSDLSAELSVPYEDMLQLEWLSNFVEDSFSGGCGTALDKQNSPFKRKELASGGPFHTSSPVSVLESSSSSTGTKNRSPSPDCSIPPRGKPGRPRSKRPRPPAFNRRPQFALLSPATSSSGETPVALPTRMASSEPEAVDPWKKRPEMGDQKKRKKIKLLGPAPPEDADQNPPAPPARKCLHCQITKTPQWRAGPTGPKTLCNACGVRFKSGRLFPEYRPAASPTFVPALHSNSHRKVLEMRGRVTGAPPVSSPLGNPAVEAAKEPEFSLPTRDAAAADHM